jgi:Cu-Zn family superoxide dismutase
MTTDSLTVAEGPASVLNRSVVITARKDDGKTQPSGNAGPAIACGVVKK